MSTRRRAREIVVQLLYEDDLNPEQDAEVADKFLQTRLHNNRPLVEFAQNLWKNVVKNRWELDKALSANATNWSLRRMAAIDRNILRMGAYEILMSETPGRVAINEAVELAKRYGNHNSGQFVNGILDRILNTKPTDMFAEDGEPAQESPDAEGSKPEPIQSGSSETGASVGTASENS